MQEETLEQEEELPFGEEKLKVVGLHRFFTFGSRCSSFLNSMITPVATGLQEVCTLILQQLRGATETAVSFQIEKEDHTLGNALRYFINKKSAFQHVCPHGTD